MLCLSGACSYRFNDQLYEMRAGDLSIIRKKNLIEDVNPSADFDLLKWRFDNVGHRFNRETIINAMQATILDFYDFHAQLYGENDISTQNASIMSRFLSMLEDGAYREHRKVAYYANLLCVSTKYLSEVSKKVSGSAANFWINRYAILTYHACCAINRSLSRRFPMCSAFRRPHISADTSSRIWA